MSKIAKPGFPDLVRYVFFTLIIISPGIVILEVSLKEKMTAISYCMIISLLFFALLHFRFEKILRDKARLQNKQNAKRLGSLMKMHPVLESFSTENGSIDVSAAFDVIDALDITADEKEFLQRTLIQELTGGIIGEYKNRTEHLN